VKYPEHWERWLSAAARDPSSSQRLQVPRERNGRIASGILTGQDRRCLNAIAPLWELYAGGDEATQRAALTSVRWVVSVMQEGARPFAKELIARSLDWKDRDRIWALVTAPNTSQLRPADTK